MKTVVVRRTKKGETIRIEMDKSVHHQFGLVDPTYVPVPERGEKLDCHKVDQDEIRRMFPNIEPIDHNFQLSKDQSNGNKLQTRGFGWCTSGPTGATTCRRENRIK